MALPPPVPKFLIKRFAVEFSPETRGIPSPLSSWREIGAYVLLAEPGAGKTETFRYEARETDSEYITASDFITLRSRNFNTSKPIFIDGLDEIRAGSVSYRAPLDEIRKRLDELGRPKYRISCREADWRSAVDSEKLKAVAPNGEFAELHLQELNDQDIASILQNLGVGDPEKFLAESERHGIRPLLGNPLLLNLMAKAVGTPRQWPDNRSAIYSMACRQLAIEHNEEHRSEKRWDQLSIDQLLHDAGLISALLLLAGIPGIANETYAPGESKLSAEMLPKNLHVNDVGAALSSKLFLADGRQLTPRHRTIAEFLGARVVSEKIEAGLPIRRVLALVSGSDGGVVDPLRGFHAWLATCCKSERRLLIDRDPLGIVLYGDLKSFTTQEKGLVLEALNREAQRFAWFRRGHWEDHPFGALGTPDMADVFRNLLASSDRSVAHQSLLGCVLDAIKFGDPMPDLLPHLLAIVRDSTFGSNTRLSALDAWLAEPTPDWLVARLVLDEINAGKISDPEDKLAGCLLNKLYPEFMGPEEVIGYFHSPKSESFYGQYQDFWRRRLIKSTSHERLRDLMAAWVQSKHRVDEDRYTTTRHHIAGDLLTAALRAAGDDVSIETLYLWLGVALDKHGFLRLTDDDVKGARDWLSERPDKIKGVILFGWSKVPRDKVSSRRFFWEAEERVLRSELPSDWPFWLLEQAASTNDEELAKYCFETAARSAIDNRPRFPMTLEAVEDWVKQNRKKWRDADQWLQAAWTEPLDHWKREEKIRKREHDSKRELMRRERRRHIEPLLKLIQSGNASPGVMHQVALAYDKRYFDIHGETPLERVQDFLGGSHEEAALAIEGLAATLDRKNLPEVDEILKLDRKGRQHFIRFPCLLGAQLRYERDPSVYLSWSDELARKLAAFWLTEGVGNQPEWFSALISSRALIVGPILEKFATQRIRKRGEGHVVGLWLLAREERFRELSRIVVPGLIRSFPIRSNETQLRILNGELLPAAIGHLTHEELSTLLGDRLKLKSLDVAQRIAYLVAGLNVNGEVYSRTLLDTVSKNESRASHVGRALVSQGDRKKSDSPLPISVTGRLIELIAPRTLPDRATGAHWVGDTENRRDWVYHLINQLASNATIEARREIERLIALKALARWKLTLEGAVFDQSRAFRDATFQFMGAQEVADVLTNKSPVNAQDFAALILDHLLGIEASLRGDDTNGLRLFRRDDGFTPKSENECRDLLLDRMRRPLLALGVNIEKEGQSANDTRVDMRAEYLRLGSRLAVPIEIKKEDHRELWSAWRTQLRKYTMDPASGGVGIYLILWFGRKVRTTSEGVRPSTPTELNRLLSDAMPSEIRGRLYSVVLDLSMDK